MPRASPAFRQLRTRPTRAQHTVWASGTPFSHQAATRATTQAVGPWQIVLFPHRAALVCQRLLANPGRGGFCVVWRSPCHATCSSPIPQHQAIRVRHRSARRDAWSQQSPRCSESTRDSEPPPARSRTRRRALAVVYANGGTGQFIVEGVDEAVVRRVADDLAYLYRERTAGEARVVAGLASWPEGTTYAAAVRHAYAQLHHIKDSASTRRTVPLLPFLGECETTSHLPAAPQRVQWGDERLFLSSAAASNGRPAAPPDARGCGPTGWSISKTRDNSQTRSNTATTSAAKTSKTSARCPCAVTSPSSTPTATPWADSSRNSTRPTSPQHSARPSMMLCGKPVSRLSTNSAPGDCGGGQREGRPKSLPADILLLGGDDLLVALLAERALPFVSCVTTGFTDRVQHRLAQTSGQTHDFFKSRGILEKGLTLVRSGNRAAQISILPLAGVGGGVAQEREEARQRRSGVWQLLGTGLCGLPPHERDRHPRSRLDSEGRLPHG